MSPPLIIGHELHRYLNGENNDICVSSFLGRAVLASGGGLQNRLGRNFSNKYVSPPNRSSGI